MNHQWKFGCCFQTGNLIVHRHGETDPDEQKLLANYIRDHIDAPMLSEYRNFLFCYFSSLWDQYIPVQRMIPDIGTFYLRTFWAEYPWKGLCERRRRCVSDRGPEGGRTVTEREKNEEDISVAYSGGSCLCRLHEGRVRKENLWRELPYLLWNVGRTLEMRRTYLQIPSWN